jgi:hypothetical protein
MKNESNYATSFLIGWSDIYAIKLPLPALSSLLVFNEESNGFIVSI